MLSHLRISNFALIEELDLNWHEGFTTITGETGAGKSIMLGALNHLLGKRADLKALKNPDLKCVIEGSFSLSPQPFQALFEDLDLDFEQETIIRREILPSGKSRAFVNDSPVRLDSLQELGMHLIDIHSQHDTLLLNDATFQLKLIDSFGEHQEHLTEYQKLYKQWTQLQKDIEGLKDEMREEGGDQDYLAFLHQELVDAKLIPGEAEELEAKLDLMEQSGKLNAALSRIQEISDSPAQGLSALLGELKLELQGISKLADSLGEFHQRAESLWIEFNDLRQEIETFSADSSFNPAEKENLDDRLSQLIHLQRKHQCLDAEELIAKRDGLEARILAAEAREENLAKAEKEAQALHLKLSDQAEQLHQIRKELKAELELQILHLLKELNMADALFTIAIEPKSDFDRMGKDQVQFLFSANPGQAPRSLQKVASGGELSRVMLALKSILARSKGLPTIIFDEIDTGVSGETALKIGAILRNMGQHMQVISISHLAQIAAGGQQQYLVKKHSSENSTRSEIFQLNQEQRLKEIARLLGGDQISEAALANARELIQAN
ncbi:MAG: DNA repair protein RecN [Bacteroidetes bacterium]|nr:DNA repair protein RecN [Bacteroidota bacterium]